MAISYVGLLGVSQYNGAGDRLAFQADVGATVLVYVCFGNHAAPFPTLFDSAGNAFTQAVNSSGLGGGDLAYNIPSPPAAIAFRQRLYAGVISNATAADNFIQLFAGDAAVAEEWDGIDLSIGFSLCGGASGSPPSISAAGTLAAASFIGFITAGRHEPGTAPALSSIQAGWTLHNTNYRSTLPLPNPTFNFGDTVWSLSRTYGASQLPSITAQVSGAGRWGVTFYNFTEAPCVPCELAIQINSACDGEPVGGGLFSLGVVGLECTQDGSGACTISDIPAAEYEWAWTKTGYDTQTGTFTCDCAGGSSEIALPVFPDGGCPGTTVYCVGLSVGPLLDQSLCVFEAPRLSFAAGPILDQSLWVGESHA